MSIYSSLGRNYLLAERWASTQAMDGIIYQLSDEHLPKPCTELSTSWALSIYPSHARNYLPSERWASTKAMHGIIYQLSVEHLPKPCTELSTSWAMSIYPSHARGSSTEVQWPLIQVHSEQRCKAQVQADGKATEHGRFALCCTHEIFVIRRTNIAN